jgi:hypothetical protein
MYFSPESIYTYRDAGTKVKKNPKFLFFFVSSLPVPHLSLYPLNLTSASLVKRGDQF